MGHKQENMVFIITPNAKKEKDTLQNASTCILKLPENRALPYFTIKTLFLQNDIKKKL